MFAYSVIVTAYNQAETLARTLASVAEAAARADPPGDVVIVNDGSTDATADLLERCCQDRPGWRTVHRPRPTSPAAARNAGVAASTGALLFFLGGDDLFGPDHVAACLAVLEDASAQFVKTRVHLADPIDSGWRRRIEGSLAINLCLRRACHDAVGGFPDVHLARRRVDIGGIDDGFDHVCDVFFKVEDMYYNQLIAGTFRGLGLADETVEYLRYPGNAFDRQYEKFRQPPGAHSEPLPPEEAFRLELADVIVKHQLARLRARRSGAFEPPAATPVKE